ncbi:hypothetical protein VCRA2112O187_13120002 [Vibrio crassostreae]|nr:hypothetical protein VCRA2112O187_13120002 [Vibrio crassostreae]CDT30104.1 hypothetical protein VCRLGP107_410288 [Vibrio crassostreae]
MKNLFDEIINEVKDKLDKTLKTTWNAASATSGYIPKCTDEK